MYVYVMPYHAIIGPFNSEYEAGNAIKNISYGYDFPCCFAENPKDMYINFLHISVDDFNKRGGDGMAIVSYFEDIVYPSSENKKTKYVVQYEVEFDSSLSVNDVVEIFATSEYDAMDQFDKDNRLKDSILKKHPGSMCVTSNAAWDS